jgi:hypothetical protein
MAPPFLTSELRATICNWLSSTLRPAQLPLNEPNWWNFVEQLDWPDPSPELDGLHEHLNRARIELEGISFVDQMALYDTMIALCAQSTALRKQWSREGSEIIVPNGTYQHSLGTYATSRNQVTYQQLISSATAATQLASTEGFLAHGQALVSLADVFVNRIQQASDSEVESLIACIAIRLVGPQTMVYERCVHHPTLGYGFVETQTSDQLSVLFADGRHSLSGHEAVTWRDATELFKDIAYRTLSGLPSTTESPMLDDTFWATVSALDWDHCRDDIAVGSKLQAMIPCLDILRFANKRHEKHMRMTTVLETFESNTGVVIEGGDDSVSDLVNHIIGIGRVEYEATLAKPARAAARADAGDYQESFAYVEQRAWESLATSTIAEALRQCGSDVLVQHATRGLGIRIPNGTVIFTET